MNGYRMKESALPSATAMAVACGLLAVPAGATEGYFMPGYSGLQLGQGGAGIANPEDAMILALNPAGLASVGEELEIVVSLFSPDRRYTATGPGFVAPGGLSSGSVASRNKFFLIPGIAYNHPLDDHSSWGVAVYGNGGMNTDYPAAANASCPSGMSGVFCGGKAGVNLSQMFVAAGYAWKSDALSLGIAPTFALQMFSAEGLGLFGIYGLSSDATRLSNNGVSTSAGFGIKAGMIYALTPALRFAVSGATPMWMSKFSKYKGLFAERGGFDIPASATAGLAWEAVPGLTAMVDYKHIFYTGTASVANAMTSPGLFGADDGAGFGWKDVDVVSLGLTYKLTPEFTLRAGYAHNNDPIDADQVTINILAPGVVTDHIAAGFSAKVSDHSIIDFAAMYIPVHSRSGFEMTPAGANTQRIIKLEMSQTILSLGYRYRF